MNTQKFSRDEGLEKPKRIRDKDVLALKGAIRALDKSTSPRMLKANLAFLCDRYLVNPVKK